MSLWIISITKQPREWLGNQRYRRENYGCGDRLDVDSPRLPSHLLQLGRLGDGLGPLIHVAQTARRQSHSCLVARLEDAERANVEQENEWKAPDEWCMNQNQQNCNDESCSKRREANGQSLAPLSCADVGDPCCG